MKGREEEYWYRIKMGEKRMLDSTIVLAGTVRDIAPILPLNIRRTEKICSLFKDYRIVLFESDSSDETLELLQRWASNNPRVTILHDTFGNPRYSDIDDTRMWAMAKYRNQYLNYIKDHLSVFDFVLVADLDFKGFFSIDGIKNSFGYYGIDCISANGIDQDHGYYDMAPFHVESFDDVWITRKPGYPNLIIKPDRHRPFYTRSQPLQKVHSAFGGLAIYKMEAFLGGEEYKGHRCDHATLAETMWANGYSEHYINPSMIGLR